MDDRTRQLREGPPVAQNRHREVFDLGVVVLRVGEHRDHLARAAHQPEEEIDVVDGVIERAPAAFALPRPPPGQVVVGQAAPPRRVHAHVRHRTEHPRVEDVLEQRRVIAEAVLGDHRQQLPRPPLRLEHGIAVLERGRHRFLDQDVHARVEGRDAERRMGGGRRRDADEIDLAPAEEVGRIVVGDDIREAEGRRLRGGTTGSDVGQSDDPAVVGELQVSPDVGVGDRARADDGDSEHGCASL